MHSKANDMILRLYDTVLDDEIWPEILNRLVDLSRAHSCIMFEWQDQESTRKLAAPFFSARYGRGDLDEYLHYFGHLEASDQKILQAQTRNVDDVELFDDAALAAADPEALAARHRDVLRDLGIFHRAAGVLNKDNRWLSLFTLQFNDAQGPLAADARADLASLLPHIAKAVDLGMPMRQLRRQADAVLSALDRLTVGICILDGAGRVALRNEEFRRQQEAYDAFHITPRGELRVADDDGRRRMETLLQTPTAHGKFGARPRKEAIRAETDAEPVLCVELSPLHRPDEFGTAAFSGFVLTSTDTSRSFGCNLAPMQQAFALTDTELSVMAAVADGFTNPQIAERRERSTATVNAQMRSILSKAQCDNRTQLVRMMMRFGTDYLHPPHPDPGPEVGAGGGAQTGSLP